MIYILLCVNVVMVLVVVYMNELRRRDKMIIDEYFDLLVEFTAYLHDKKNGRDFTLWRKELRE